MFPEARKALANPDTWLSGFGIRPGSWVGEVGLGLRSGAGQELERWAASEREGCGSARDDLLLPEVIRTPSGCQKREQHSQSSIL